jgi:hypothetical protein
MTMPRRAGAAAILVLAFAGTWIVLDRTDRPPRWLAVEAPRAAHVGGTFEVRVRLDDAVGPTRVVCTLHRAGADRRIRGFLASAGPPRDVVRGGTHSFVFAVPDRDDMAFVSAIVFLSPTGRWEDGTHAASTKLAPAIRGPGPGPERALVGTRVFHFQTSAQAAAATAREKRPSRKPSPLVHPFFFVLLLASALACLAKAGRKRPDAGPGERRARTVWLLFSIVLAASAVIEVSGLAGLFADWARRTAEARNLYDIRRIYQKAIMAGVASGGLGLFLLFLRAARRPAAPRFEWLAGLGLAAYLALSFVGVLSFHAVDVVRRMTWLGVSPFDAARGAGAGIVLLAAILAPGPGKGAEAG